MVVTDALRQVRRLALCGASVLVLGGMQGCQMFGWFQDPPPDPYRSLQVEAALDVNPDIHGRPSPVILTIYHLEVMPRHFSRLTRPVCWNRAQSRPAPPG